MSKQCIEFLKAACKTKNIPFKEAKHYAWGRAAGSNEYWIGDKSETITAHCINCARAKVILDDLTEKRLWEL